MPTPNTKLHTGLQTGKFALDDTDSQYEVIVQDHSGTHTLPDAWGMMLELKSGGAHSYEVEEVRGFGGGGVTLKITVRGQENAENAFRAMKARDRLGDPQDLRDKARRNAPQKPGTVNFTPPPGATPSGPPQPSNYTGGSVAKNCHDCPALVPHQDHSAQRRLFGGVTGLAMCGQLGIPLSTRHSTGEQIESIMKEAPKICGRFGRDWSGELDDIPDPADRDALMFRFAIPFQGYLEKAKPLDINNPDDFKPPAAACPGCKNYIAPGVLQRAIGIPLGGCAAKGSLIATGTATRRATGCEYNVQDDRAGHLVDMSKMWLTQHLNGHVTIIDSEGDAVVPDTLEAPAEPTEIESDKEVTDADRAKGVRAWVKLTDPEDAERFVFMPVFDPDFFTPEERAKIPQTGDDEHPELYQDHLGLLYKAVVIWIRMNETPALNGVAGTGKTDFFRYVAWRMQLPFERVSITDSTELDELAGKMLFEQNETTFQYGRIPNAWGKPCVVVIDEPNVGSPAVWQFLRPLTDNSKQLVLDQNKGERIDRNEFCFMGMAFNPSWDVRNVGTHEISDADGRRLMHIAVPTPTKEIEKQILTRRCLADGYKITPATLKLIMGVSEDLRALAKNDTIPIQWGTAQNIKVARSTQWFSIKDCYRLAAADLLEPAACEQIMDAVNNHVSGKTKKQNSPF
ncbi:AAA ATPase [Rhodococcus phage Mbo2]|uniref:AAA ATPase n=1 Tax=Rhodococcus phage Mbo2 TaxID=2936911 RepID=A0A9E7IEJ0_9CAUD|nr:AAA ATPase [Rhodococcus phage Mbo2]